MNDIYDDIFLYNTKYVAEILCDLAFENPDSRDIESCEEALYQLKTLSENPLNKCQKTLYRVLQKIVDNNTIPQF